VNEAQYRIASDGFFKSAASFAFRSSIGKPESLRRLAGEVACCDLRQDKKITTKILLLKV
jgi:hypothetical protein